jgi:hypothetical protein
MDRRHDDEGPAEAGFLTTHGGITGRRRRPDPRGGS